MMMKDKLEGGTIFVGKKEDLGIIFIKKFLIEILILMIRHFLLHLDNHYCIGDIDSIKEIMKCGKLRMVFKS